MFKRIQTHKKVEVGQVVTVYGELAIVQKVVWFGNNSLAFVHYEPIVAAQIRMNDVKYNILELV